MYFDNGDKFTGTFYNEAREGHGSLEFGAARAATSQEIDSTQLFICPRMEPFFIGKKCAQGRYLLGNQIWANEWAS